MGHEGAILKWDFVLIRYDNMTETNISTFEKVYWLQFPREEGTPGYSGPHGEAPILMFPREDMRLSGRQV